MDVPIESICSLGVGGVLAIIIFLMYRRDRKASEKQIRDDRIFMEDRYCDMIKEDQATRESHTKVLTELVTLLKRMNGRHNS